MAEFRFLADGKPLIPPQKLQIKVLPPPVFPETPLQKFRLLSLQSERPGNGNPECVSAILAETCTTSGNFSAVPFQ